MRLSAISIDRKAIELADAVRSRQRALAAAASAVRRVPRSVAAAIAIGKANLSIRPTGRGGESATRGLRGRARDPCYSSNCRRCSRAPFGERATVRLRAGKHLVAIGVRRRLDVVPIASRESGKSYRPGTMSPFSVSPVNLLRLLPRRASSSVSPCKWARSRSNHLAVDVVPGTVANAIARIDRRLTRTSLRAEIRMPGAVDRRQPSWPTPGNARRRPPIRRDCLHHR